MRAASLLVAVVFALVGVGATAGPASALTGNPISPGQQEFLIDSTGNLKPGVQALVQDGAAVNQLATKSPSLFGRVSSWLTKGFLPTAARVTGLGGVALALNEVCRAAASQPGGLECWLYKTSPVAGGPGGAVQWSVNQNDALQVRWNSDLGRYQVRRQAAGSSSGPTAWANDSVGAWSPSTSRAAFPADLEGVWFTYLYIASQGPQYGPTYPSGSSQYYVTNAPNPVPQGFVRHTAPNGDSVWARTDQEGVEITHKTGGSADDPSVPNRAVAIPVDGDWAKQMADALHGPYGADIADWLQYQLAPETYEDPTDTRPKVLAVQAHETYEQYVARLRAAGVVGTITRVDLTDASLDPQRGPSEAVRTSPRAGTRLDADTELKVFTNPETAEEPGTETTPEPGTQPGSGGSPTIPAINLDPLKQTTPCDSFPFGVPCWVSGALGGFNAPGHAPSFHWDLPFGLAIDIDLEEFRPATEIYKPVILFGAILAMGWGFMRLAMGGNDGGAPD